MSFKSLFSTAAVVAAVLGFAGAASAQISPDPSQVYIKRLTYAGPGCPTGSVAHNISPDALAFTVLFDQFNAQIGPGVPGGLNKTSCRLTVDFRYPLGWTYTLFTVDYRGYADLESGVTARKKSNYYFQATPGIVTRFEKAFAGPFSDNFQVRDTTTMSELVWANCEKIRAFNIDTELAVTSSNPASSGQITVDSIDGALTQIYAIKWARCP
jgi:hypothetical protein